MVLSQQDIHISHTYIKVNMNQNINVKPEIMELLEETIEICRYGFGYDKDFLDMTPKA